MHYVTKYLIPSILLLAVLAPDARAQGPKTDDTRYRVVINHEEQYSVWPTGRDVPKGWKVTGFTGSLDEAHDYIEEVWTDMRPLSLRKRMKKEGLKLDDTRYRVVINHEEQYSVVLADRDVPRGWKATRFTGTLSESHDYIEEVWTDMRPRSLRKKK